MNSPTLNAAVVVHSYVLGLAQLKKQNKGEISMSQVQFLEYDSLLRFESANSIFSYENKSIIIK